VASLDFHGDQASLPGFHHIIRFTHQAKLMIHQSLRNPLPEVSICIYHLRLGQPAFPALAHTEQQQSNCQPEQEQNQPPQIAHLRIQIAKTIATTKTASASHR